MIDHARSVRIGVKKSLLTVDMPYNTYRNKNEALKNLSMLLENSTQESEQLPLALVETGRIAFLQNNLVLARKALQQYVENQSLTSFKKNLATQMPQVMYYMGWVNNEENKFKKPEGYKNVNSSQLLKRN